MTRNLQPAFDMAQSFEGLAYLLPDGTIRAYPDPATHAEPWTIGYGSTGPDITKSTIWTKAQCIERFQMDMTKFANGVEKLLTHPTTDIQFCAMLDLSYNIGLGNFKSSTLLRLHNSGAFPAAANQFLRWNKANGKEMPGLTRRRHAEQALYLKS